MMIQIPGPWNGEASETLDNLNARAAGFADAAEYRELHERFQVEGDWARWIKEVPLADGSAASVYVAPQHPRELRETMVWSVDLAHERALAG